VIVGATSVFLPEGVRREQVLRLDSGGRILEIRTWKVSDPDLEEGMLIPSLVNAHTHLELSGLRGTVPGGEGLVRWVGQLLRQRATAEDQSFEGAMELVRHGTGVVCDVSNSGETRAALQKARLSGVIQRELLTLDASLLPRRIREASEPDVKLLEDGQKWWTRPSPHALYSTAPALVKACVQGREPAAEGRPPATIHLAEDMEEIRFLRDGGGAWARFLDGAGIDWRWWQPTGGSPVDLLSELGVLGPDLLLVHGVHLTGRDRRQIAESGAALVLCARSNLHIHGELPDGKALVDMGIPLALGTDSLGSCPDLDVLSEIPLLGQAFPAVDPRVWLHAATAGGAQALKFGRGELAVGASPGVVLLEGVDRVESLVERAPSRRWMVRPRFL